MTFDLFLVHSHYFIRGFHFVIKNGCVETYSINIFNQRIQMIETEIDTNQKPGPFTKVKASWYEYQVLSESPVI